MKLKIFITIIIISTISSCSLILNGRYGRENFNMKREPYIGEGLKTNGIYQTKLEEDYALFFYKNGVLLTPFCLNYTLKEKEKTIDYFKTINKENNPCNDIVYAWGIFIVEGDVLSIESWVSGEFGHKYRTKVSNGRIINDSTIYINDWGIKDRDTFNFIALPSKPDSTNNFIK